MFTVEICGMFIVEMWKLTVMFTVEKLETTGKLAELHCLL
jgi:hypothetical protein